MWLIVSLARDRRQKAGREPMHIPSGFIVGKYRRGHVADDLAFHHINYEFSNIGGMVGDTFKRFADESQANGSRNRCRIFDHEGQQFAKELVREIVYEVIVGTYLSCQGRVRTD